MRKSQPGESITNTYKGPGAKPEELKLFKLSLKGGQPKINDAPKVDPTLGERTDGGGVQQVIPKEPCIIEVILALRKKQPGGNYTSTVPAKELKDLKQPEVAVFKLK